MSASPDAAGAAPAEETNGGAVGSPSEFLKAIVGKPVVIRLNSGVDYKGVLNALDGFMNVALEDTKEFVDGQQTNDYGDAFIRGNNGASLSRSFSLLRGS